MKPMLKYILFFGEKLRRKRFIFVFIPLVNLMFLLYSDLRNKEKRKFSKNFVGNFNSKQTATQNALLCKYVNIIFFHSLSKRRLISYIFDVRILIYSLKMR